MKWSLRKVKKMQLGRAMQKNKKLNFLNISAYPCPDFKISKKIDVFLDIDMYKMFVKKSNRPVMFCNMSVNQQRALYNFEEFEIRLYKNLARKSRSPKSSVRIFSGTQQLVGTYQSTNLGKNINVLSPTSHIARVSFTDYMTSNHPGASIVYSCEIEYKDRLNSKIYNLRDILEKRLINIEKQQKIMNLPSYRRDKSPDTYLGLGNSYYLRGTPKRSLGTQNKEGLYTKQFQRSFIAEQMNLGIESLIDAYTRCLFYLYGKDKILTSSMRRYIKEGSDYEENRDIYSKKFYATLRSSVIVKENNSNNSLYKFMKDCRKLLKTVKKIVPRSQIDDLNNINKVKNNTVQLSKVFYNNPIVVTEDSIDMPCVYDMVAANKFKNDILEVAKEVAIANNDSTNYELESSVTEAFAPIFGAQKRFSRFDGMPAEKVALRQIKKLNDSKQFCESPDRMTGGGGY